MSQAFSKYHLLAITVESLVMSQNCADTSQLSATSAEKFDIFGLPVDQKERKTRSTTAEESKVETKSVIDNEVGGSCRLISTTNGHTWH